jgi:DNA anti-recombination protein RmuC
MRTKKYKRNNRKTRKIRGGAGFFDGLTTQVSGYFKTTSDTNKNISEIKELKTTLANNMQQLTKTYESVLTKVTALQSKIDNLSSNSSSKNGTENSSATGSVRDDDEESNDEESNDEESVGNKNTYNPNENPYRNNNPNEYNNNNQYAGKRKSRRKHRARKG